MASPSAIPMMVATFAGLVLLFSQGQAKAATKDAPKTKPKAETKPSATKDAPKTKPKAETKPSATTTTMQKVAAAIAAEDWELASALAIADYFATGSEDAVRRVSAARRAADLEFTSILSVLARDQKAPLPTLAKPKATPTKKAEPVATKVVKEKAAPAATKVTTKGTGTTTSGEKKTEKGAKVAEVVSQRSLLAELVATEISETKKGQEDQSLVKEYQRAAGIKVDGKYGPATAQACWDDGVELPPNPRYWPDNPDAAKASYRTFLRKMAQAHPERKAAIDKLIGAL